jgi:hypothetical protein
MGVINWATPRAVSSNFASTSLDSLANGSTSAFVTYDNSSNLDEYGNFSIALGSITPTTGGSITLRLYACGDSGTAPDDTGSVGGGDPYTVPLTTSASAKFVTIPGVKLYAFSLRVQITNNAGVALAASGNSIKVQGYTENVT